MSFRASDPDLGDAASEPLWRALFPDDLVWSAGFAPPDAALSPAELASLGTAGDSRRRQFAAGRWHAKAALAKIGRAAADLPRAASGAPAWPAGTTGSIAHAEIDGRVFAVAVVARADRYAALGVDLEPRQHIAPRDWPALLAVDELASIESLAVEHRSLAVLQLWCAKEAAAKAAVGELPDVRRVAVTASDGEPGLGAGAGTEGVRAFAVRGTSMRGRVGLAPALAAAFCAIRPSVAY